MRSVRCEMCGTKALVAASQCPQCGHLFEIRDGFGALVPLAQCRSCDTYYPARAGECKWCGPAPRPSRAPFHFPKHSAIVGAFIAVGAAGWMLGHGGGPRSASPVVRVQAPPADSTNRIAPPIASAPQGDTATSPASAPVDGVAGAAAASAAIPAITPAIAPVRRWTRMIAREWIVVRSDARRTARIVASVGPNSRVQVGEERDGWRRLRARGVVGWIDTSRATLAAPAEPRLRGTGSR